MRLRNRLGLRGIGAFGLCYNVGGESSSRSGLLRDLGFRGGGSKRGAFGLLVNSSFRLFLGLLRLFAFRFGRSLQ